MPSAIHAPFGMDHSETPFDDPDEGRDGLPPPLEKRAPRSAHDSSVATTAHGGSNSDTNSHSNRSKTQDLGGGTNTSSQTQRRLSDFNASSSALLDASQSARLMYGPSLPLVAPQTPSKATAEAQQSQNPPVQQAPPYTDSYQQQEQQKQQEKGEKEKEKEEQQEAPPPSQIPPPPPRVARQTTDPSPPETLHQTSVLPSPNSGCATLPPTITTRRVVGFVSTPSTEMSPTPTVIPATQQLSSSFSGSHASLLNSTDARGTQRTSDVTAQASASAIWMSATIPEVEEEVEAALNVSSADAPESLAKDSGKRQGSSGDKKGKVTLAVGDEGEGDDDTQPSSHMRYNKAYTNLVIQKPIPGGSLDTPLPFGTALARGDSKDVAQKRASGTLNSDRLPVFDRAKQMLLTPVPGSTTSPCMRYCPMNSVKDGPPLSATNIVTAAAEVAKGSTNATPRSARGRRFTTLITPLLRTPLRHQQSSGISSPLVVDRAVLEEPAQSPATFGDRLKEMGDEDGDYVKTHMVWQAREGRTRCVLSPHFLLISVNDRVCIHWYDSSEEVFETDNTYLNVVPGGRHSCYNAASTPADGDGNEVNAGNAGAFEVNHVWSTPGDGGGGDSNNTNDRMATSHALGRPSGIPGTLTVRPQLGNSNPNDNKAKEVGSTPLVIRVRTPRLGRTESLGGTVNQLDSAAGTPGTAHSGGPRTRQMASVVFLTHDDDGGGAVADSGNHISVCSEPNHPERSLFANSVTPLVTGHSRQPSGNWMLQRSATRQSLGENYQSFTIRFRKPGDYYFVCSKHKRTMRLQVQVQSKHSLIRWRVVLVVGAAILVVALIVIVVVVLAYWMQHSTYIFGEKDSATYEQYIAFLNIHDLITIKLFPFLAVGVLIVLFVILGAVGWAVYRCFQPARQGAYTRGVYASTRRTLVLGTVLLTFAMIVVLFVAFGLEMNVMNGVNQLALSIGSGVTSTLNLYSTAVLQVNYVVNETAMLFPNITLPTADIYSISAQVTNLMSEIVSWTSFVEDIAQVAFRVIPIIMYLAMQLGLFAGCLTIGALMLRLRKAAVATTWMLAASLGVFSVVCGVEFAVTKLFSNVYVSVVVLRDNPTDFGTAVGLANDSFVSELLSYCTITVKDVSSISDYVNEIMSSINKTLDPEGQKAFSSIFQFIHDAVPGTLESLANYTNYISANLDALQQILDANGAQVNDIVHKNVVPLLRTILSVIQTFEGLVNCQVIRDIVAAAIPIFQKEVKNYNLAVFSFLLIVFGISFILLIFSAGATYSIRNPRRTWCNMRSGRWFRFRYSYKTHISTLMQGASLKTRHKTVLQWLVHHTAPIMYQLQNVKLVCYSACALMFFDCILIVLFNDVSRGTRTSKMLQALSYLGCVVVFFLLLASLFRQAVVRWIFHFCSLLCAAACLGVSVSQSIVGFVYFGQCVDHTRYELSSLTYGSPVFLTCSATYMGYNLEVAIYSIIIFFNSITVVVTLAIQIRYERNLKASFQHRHYIGILSPLDNFFPWLKCVFADYLTVKRIYYGFLIFVTVVFLILFALLDIGRWSVLRGVPKPTLEDSDIIQAIDPNVGCNGDSRYCSLRTNEIIWACAHNAHSSLEDGFVMPNHYYNISHQLSAGIRSFMVDVWYDKINSSISDEEDVYVCHAVCLMGRRRWRDIAREFKEFLDKYPGQVIMIFFEQYVNSSSLGKISDDVGLTEYVWYNDQIAPNFNPNYQWPTLQQLINTNQRVMMYNDEMATESASIGCPTWLYYSFDFLYENYYETSSVKNWVCDIHRGWCTPDATLTTPVNCSDPENSNTNAYVNGSSSSESHCAYLATVDITNCTEYGADPLWKNGSAAYNAVFHANPPNVRSKMSTMNHFITNGAGSPVQATQANQPMQVQSTTYMCSSTWNTVVNILAFDFWNIANPLGTIQEMNQNLVKYGSRYHFQDQWAKMLFGKDSVTFSTE